MTTVAYVYKWEHLPTKMWYIGSRTARGCHPDDGYICSSKYVKPLILENRSDWNREIIDVGSKEEMRLLEHAILEATNAANDPRSFNRNNVMFVVDKTSSEGKIRIHKNDEDIFIDPDKLKFYEELGWSAGFSNKVRDAMCNNHADVSGAKNPMYGTNRSGSLAPYYGKHHSEETLNKLRSSKSDEHKKKLSIAKQGENNPMFGKKQTAETCEKRSRSLKGRIPWNKGRSSKSNII